MLYREIVIVLDGDRGTRMCGTKRCGTKTTVVVVVVVALGGSKDEMTKWLPFGTKTGAP